MFRRDRRGGHRPPPPPQPRHHPRTPPPPRAPPPTPPRPRPPPTRSSTPHPRGALPFFFNDTATTEIYPLSLHDALPILTRNSRMPESLAADLDAECAACLMGASRLAELFGRYGKDAVET